MTYKEALAYLENYTWSKTRLGLGRTRELCAGLGDPQKKLKFIHVGGSNGKGSTCAMLASVLETAGYRTGLYTSPYIQTFCERIQINGENIPADRLAEITVKLRDAAESMEDHPSWFEMVTAVAFQYFMEEGCDIVVLEVGMGGEFDSTNVIDAPELAILTNIGLEHTEYLGDTIEAIAATKSGIIKPGCDVVSYDNTDEVKAIINEAAERSSAPLIFADPARITLRSRDLSAQVFEWEGREYSIPLHGEHQLKNASVVMEGIGVLRRRGWEIPEEAVRKGLTAVRWPARFQIMTREPLFILDGGHNPQCAEALVQCISDLLPGQKVDFLLGILADKDYSRMVDILAPYAASFRCIAPENERALGVGELAEEIRARVLDSHVNSDIDIYAYDDLDAAINAVLQSAADNDRPAVCFGSLYLAGEILNEFNGIYKKWLRERRTEAREALSDEERERFSSEISQRIADLPAFSEAKSVMIYRGIRGEARLDELAEIARKEGKRVLYPVCTGIAAADVNVADAGAAGSDATDVGAAGAEANTNFNSNSNTNTNINTNTNTNQGASSDITREAADKFREGTDAGVTDIGEAGSEMANADVMDADTGGAVDMLAVEPGRGDDAWRSGAFGIPEPSPDAGTVVAPEDIDLVVCPCTSFDESCSRLGMGGGYYDRFLPACVNAEIIAAAFEVQKALQIPVSGHDIAMDAVVTESGVYRSL